MSGAVNICSGLYAAVGLFGYVAFHDVELHGDILLYLQSSFLTQMMKLAFMLSVAVSIPLVLFPSRIAFYNLFLKPVFFYDFYGESPLLILFACWRKYSKPKSVAGNQKQVIFFTR